MSALTLSHTVKRRLADCASRLGVSEEIALEMAINRMHINVANLREGDLNLVDFTQSLTTGHGSPGSTSKSIPGCEDW